MESKSRSAPGPPEATTSGAQRVLDAAAELFANEDYASVSISAIAEQAGVSKANIYH
ncbi:MAG: helix-turn-helix domain-containing protein, partial [Acidobacteriota bacterium]|nr:helix-turn-helix domain-containing protein [Acidobacteriota bacterium]